MQMKAYTNGKFHVLARPMVDIDFHCLEEECEVEDLEGMEVKAGFFIVFSECHRAWAPKAVFERDYKELTE